MWLYEFRDRITAISCYEDKVAIGCENGWIYLFDDSGLLWSKKLVSTYYRGPFTDVNVTSLNINDRYLVVGTDFADGKVYLFNLKGKKLWERQLMSVLGCWERPEDVKVVKIAKIGVVAVSGFVNDNLHLFNLKGDQITVKTYKNFVNCLDADKVVGIGTCKWSEIIGVKRFERPARDVVVIDDWAIFANDAEVFCSLGWTYKAVNPKIFASEDYICFSSKNKVILCNLDGKVEREIEVVGDIVDLRVEGDDVVIGTKSGLYVNSSKVLAGRVFKVGKSFAILREKNELRYVSI
jgi:hypothetical protein